MPRGASYASVLAYINTRDYQRWLAAVTRLETEMEGTVSEYNRINATKYRNLVIQNIMSQKFAPDYKPLSLRYVEWKIKHGFPMSHWILKGDLLRNIIVQRAASQRTDWESGPDPVALDSGGKNWALNGPAKLISKYAAWGEYGTSKQPPRPIFAPTTYEFQTTYWQVEADRVLKKIQGKWR